jgi:hypothetical protein
MLPTAQKNFKLCLQPVWACCSRTCCRLFEHVAAGHVAACSSMLQPDMLLPVQACCSRTFAACSSIAGHLAACSSMLQPDMWSPVWACCSRTFSTRSSMLQLDILPPAWACCSLIRTCCSQDRIFSSLLVQASICAAQTSIDQRNFQEAHVV